MSLQEWNSSREWYSYIRYCLSTVPVLSFWKFMCRNPHDPYNLTNEMLSGYWEAYNLERDVYGSYDFIRNRVEYLHYLCYMGNGEYIQEFVMGLHADIRDRGVVETILNYHDTTCNGTSNHYGGTPLHTLISWNNSVEIAQFLIQNGCEKSLTTADEYGMIPCKEIVDESTYYPPFQVGCEIDNWQSSENCYYLIPIRCCEDFKHVCDYLSSRVDDIKMREWLHMHYSNKKLKDKCPDYASSFNVM